ncbi:MAG: hypothetical protein ACRYGL_05350 [Janthinobacterium lividum]
MTLRTPSPASCLGAALSVAIIVATAGCASATKTYGSDGRPVIGINCSGSARSWDACLTRAGEECGTSGYTIIGQGGEQSQVANGGYGSYFESSTHKRTMVIACNAPVAR